MESANQGRRSYYIDSNAWINLGNDAILYKSIMDKHSRRQISILIAMQLVGELVTRPELTKIQADSNRMLLEPFLGRMVDDRLFVLEVSLLDAAVLGSDPANALYTAHVNQKQGKNDFRDGIHLVNASEFGAVIVTCDKKLRLSAQRRCVQFMCLADLAAECNLASSYNCPGCQ